MGNAIELECIPQVRMRQGPIAIQLGKVDDEFRVEPFGALGKLTHGEYGKIYAIELELEETYGGDLSRLDDISLPSCIERRGRSFKAVFPVDLGRTAVLEFTGVVLLTTTVEPKRLSSIIIYPRYYMYKIYGRKHTSLSLVADDDYDDVLIDGSATAVFYADSDGRFSRVEVEFRYPIQIPTEVEGNGSLDVSYRDGVLTVAIRDRDVKEEIGRAKGVWAVAYSQRTSFTRLEIYDIDPQLLERIRLY